MKFWEDVFGKETWAVDCYRTWIHHDDYGNREKTRIRANSDGKSHNYGWTIDHIRPKSKFQKESESDFFNNFVPVHYTNNEKKSDNYPSFEINGDKYQVVKCDICGSHGLLGYGIKKIETGKRVDWNGVQGRYYT